MSLEHLRAGVRRWTCGRQSSYPTGCNSVSCMSCDWRVLLSWIATVLFLISMASGDVLPGTQRNLRWCLRHLSVLKVLCGTPTVLLIFLQGAGLLWLADDLDPSQYGPVTSQLLTLDLGVSCAHPCCLKGSKARCGSSRHRHLKD